MEPEVKISGGLMEQIRESNTSVYKTIGVEELKLSLDKLDLSKFASKWKGMTSPSHLSSLWAMGIDPIFTSPKSESTPVIEPQWQSTEYPVSRLIKEKILNK